MRNYRGTTYRNNSVNGVFGRKILIPNLQETKKIMYS